ncbi:Transcription initiation factor IIA large subunit [Wickerhamiella sorbophila]|uniref:Transcription initiation factor IIA large subunit n=1 Tax=Wickerhamiella sorbophila TaxID=45607 RepID=A0A2T0FEX5_9ASCO|nr:Transcription initiation factor IIA large subunit [Wickerhamiella sorbophila]PRT53524.1 Transcription initiation factor IIA large subunit [Wickerhamiella sorbophila]
MSNNVGPLYSSIIETVLQEATREFEEHGEDVSVLRLLRTAWQKRLSEMHITDSLPWNYEAPAAASNVPSMFPGIDMSTKPQQFAMYPGMSGVGANGLDGAAPLLDAAAPPMSNYVKKEEIYGNPAALRAAQQVQAYGSSLPGVDQSVLGLMNRAGEDHDNDKNGLVLPGNIPQTDGLAEDPEDVRTTIGKIMARHMVDGDVNDGDDGDDLAGLSDEEVNSDLDDSEDEYNSDNDVEDPSLGVMLCLYDRVQRVKNKWKYVLKDGVATVNNTDYIFNKATGESEW